MSNTNLLENLTINPELELGAYEDLKIAEYKTAIAKSNAVLLLVTWESDGIQEEFTYAGAMVTQLLQAIKANLGKAKEKLTAQAIFDAAKDKTFSGTINFRNGFKNLTLDIVPQD